MKKVFLLLVLLVAFTSCDIKHHKKTILHTYVSDDNGDGVFYWYMFYGDNGTYYTYGSRIPMSDFTDITWNVSTNIPKEISKAEELEQTELDDTAVEETASDAVDSSPEASADADSGSDSGSGDSGGGDGGGDGGGGGD